MHRLILTVILLAAMLCAAGCDEGSGIATQATCSDDSSCAVGQQCIAGACVDDEGEGAGNFNVQEPDSDPTTGDPTAAQDAQVGASEDVTSLSDASSPRGPDDVEQDPTPEPDVAEPCVGGSGCFGDPCSDGSDCYSGLCGQHMGDEVCTKTCDNECPAGWTCEQVNLGGGDTTYICVSAVEHLCTPCFDAEDCASDASQASCVSYGGQGSFCGAACDSDADCPEGFDCLEAPSTRGGSSAQCVKSDGPCECSDKAVSLGLATACTVTNSVGSCTGVSVCTDEGLSECDAQPAVEDICNGLDDDCDGDLDTVPCDDEDPCTEDSCEGESGCVHSVSAGVPCDDGDDATSGDTCDATGACTGEVITCPEGPCVLSAAPDGATCAVIFAEEGAACDDSDTATQGDTCDDAGGCAGVPYSCTAAQCEASSEVNGVDCDVTYKAAGEGCDDGDPATKTDACDGAGTCSGETFGCTPSQCEASATPNGAACDVTFKAAGLPCDDGEPTTKDDVCDGEGGCEGSSYSCVPGTCEATATPDGAGCAVTYVAAQAACDDGDPTTKIDICDGQGGCAGSPYTCVLGVCDAASVPNGIDCDVTFKASGIECDDGQLNTLNDQCDGLGGCNGAPYTCQPGTCELEATPNGSDCDVVFAPADASCDDGDISTAMDTCNGAGACAGQPITCAPGSCEMSASPNGVDCDVIWSPQGVGCDDGEPTTKIDICDGQGGCAGTLYSCTPGPCDAASVPNGIGCDVLLKAAGVPCDDGQLDTQGDTCDEAGACVGSPYTCPQGSCIMESTPNGEGCDVSYANAGTSCDDGLLTTGGDVCDGEGSCIGQPLACEPQSCQLSSVANGEDCDVVWSPLGVACDDDDPSTKLDICDGAGGCAGESYTCEATQCEAASTPNGEGCDVFFMAEGFACDDGDPNTKSDTCDGQGGCTGTSYTCEPGPCEVDAIPDGDGCTPVFAAAGSACDDGASDTRLDACDGAGECLGEPYTCIPTQCEADSIPNGIDCDPLLKVAGSACDDLNLETQDDMCHGDGACIGTPYSCSAGVCELESLPDGDGCVPVLQAPGTVCDDGDLNTTGDSCNAVGQCLGESYTCQPNQCQVSSVVNGTDCDIVHEPAGTTCDDGDLATAEDTCDGQGGCIGVAIVCDVGVCQDQSEPNGEGCTVTYSASGAECDDGQPTTKGDVCDGAGECAGTPYSCPTSDCTPEAFPNGIDCHNVHALAGATCDDGVTTTQDDVCDGMGACEGTPYTCTPGLCEDTSVPNGSDCTVTFSPEGTPCDDADPTTNETTCNTQGECTAGGLSCGSTSCQLAFSYTGNITTFTIPAGVHYVEIETFGAQGGTGTTGGGGLGAYMKGGLNVSPGDVLDILVGGEGRNDPTGGHNGNSTGGGGGSFVALNGAPLIIAGGGGGTGQVSQGQPGLTTTNGAAGLGPGGGDGGSAGLGGGANGGHNSGRGGAGFQGEGNVPSCDGGCTCSGCASEAAQPFVNGGAGSPNGPHHGGGGFGGGGAGGNYGGGGGGGYSGGGGGSSNGFGGGGGGSFCAGELLQSSSGQRSGHGRVFIQW
ncbi:MAG: hypothetical protein ACPGU1_08325 [Myxococcota bacterium]